MRQFTEKHIRRFNAKFIRGQDDECWNWLASVDRYGYGRFRYPRGFLASRFSYWLATGINPEDLCVCHSCDNPKCVNPNHLWLGTHRDNMHDAIRKRRLFRRKNVINIYVTIS